MKIILVALSFGIAAGVLTAAVAPGSVPAPPAAIPELFAGELDDVGPQFLLVAASRPSRFELWGEVEITGTSNATLVESDPSFSTITSMQAGGTLHSAARPCRGGELAFETGFRVQTYRYGLFAGTKRKINFLEIDRNDFDLLGAHAQAAWRRQGWLATAAIRGASLRNRGNNRVFYRELSVESQLFHQWRVGVGRVVIAGFEGAARWSHTDSFGLLPRGWNNRVEAALVGVVEQTLARGWRLQPAVRVQGSKYLHRDRERSDAHASMRLTLVRALGAHAELRLGGGYDQRESSEPGMADFSKWDLALAGGAHWRF